MTPARNGLAVRILIFCVALPWLWAGLAAAAGPDRAESRPDLPSSQALAGEKSPGFVGMDEAVNKNLAAAAGRPAREPYLNLEERGDVWNTALLIAGAVCGFILGRWWHLLWGKDKSGRAGNRGAEIN